MADYEYDLGLRQLLINNTTKNLCRLDDYASHDKTLLQGKVREDLTQFRGLDVMIAYAANPKMHISNDYKDVLFIRGILDDVNPNDHELTFKGPNRIIEPQGINYKGNTWIVPINQLLEVLVVRDYKTNPDPYNRQYSKKEFAFGTMSGINMGEVHAYEPFGAFLKFIDQQETLRREISHNKKTTPVRLLTIKELQSMRSGTGTGYAH